MKMEDRQRIASTINLPIKLIEYELQALEEAHQQDRFEFKTLVMQLHRLQEWQKSFIADTL
jgi:hypothetical protein